MHQPLFQAFSSEGGLEGGFLPHFKGIDGFGYRSSLDLLYRDLGISISQAQGKEISKHRFE